MANLAVRASKMKNRFKRVAVTDHFAIIIAIILASPLIWWAIDRQDPVKLVQWDVAPSIVKPGERLFRIVSVIRSKSCPSDPNIVIVDAQGTRWTIDDPVVAHPGPTGIQHTYRAPVVIPDGAAQGPAEMRVTIRRECNPLQRIWPQVTVYPPLYFTIVK